MISLEQQNKILRYCRDNKTRLPNLEYYLTEPSVCYWYAANILKSRFEIGEKAISQSPYYSLNYTIDILKGRFELGEKAISNSGWYSYLYAVNVVKDIFKLGEPAIKKSNHWEDYKGLFNIQD